MCGEEGNIGGTGPGGRLPGHPDGHQPSCGREDCAEDEERCRPLKPQRQRESVPEDAVSKEGRWRGRRRDSSISFCFLHETIEQLHVGMSGSEKVSSCKQR